MLRERLRLQLRATKPPHRSDLGTFGALSFPRGAAMIGDDVPVTFVWGSIHHARPSIRAASTLRPTPEGSIHGHRPGCRAPPHPAHSRRCVGRFHRPRGADRLLERRPQRPGCRPRPQRPLHHFCPQQYGSSANEHARDRGHTVLVPRWQPDRLLPSHAGCQRHLARDVALFDRSAHGHRVPLDERWVIRLAVVVPGWQPAGLRRARPGGPDDLSNNIFTMPSNGGGSSSSRSGPSRSRPPCGHRTAHRSRSRATALVPGARLG